MKLCTPFTEGGGVGAAGGATPPHVGIGTLVSIAKVISALDIDMSSVDDTAVQRLHTAVLPLLSQVWLCHYIYIYI